MISIRMSEMMPMMGVMLYDDPMIYDLSRLDNVEVLGCNLISASGYLSIWVFRTRPITRIRPKYPTIACHPPHLPHMHRLPLGRLPSHLLTSRESPDTRHWALAYMLFCMREKGRGGIEMGHGTRGLGRTERDID